MAALFARTHPHSLWAQAGSRVAAAYFRPYFTSAAALAVVATEGDEITGACVGTMHLDRYGYRHYRRIAVPLLRAIASEMRSRPFVVLCAFLRRAAVQGAHFVVRLVRGRASFTDVEHEEHSVIAGSLPEPGKTCHMMAFCVAPEARGRQLGSQMLRRFNEEMAARGLQWCLAETTVENVASQTAQRRAGLECVVRSGQDLIFVGRIAEAS